MCYFKIFITFFILIFSVFSQAQNETTNHFGLKAGINFSNINTDALDDEHILTGYHVGFYGKFPMNNTLDIQLETLFTTKGTALTYNNDLMNGTAKFNIQYIEVPVLLVVNATPHFNFYTGPYIAYLLKGKVSNDANANLFDFENNINKDHFNQWDIGIVTGLGFDFKPASIGIRYNYGLTVVGKETSYNTLTYNFLNGRNNVLSAYFMVALN